jgi:phosphomannomutase
MINPAIFRSYDIRGSSLLDITETISYKIGFCFAKISISVGNNLICVGRDGRISSHTLYESLVKGLIDAGASIISIGIVPTPVLYFADQKFQPAASIMITGSHNPKDDNGFKMVSHGLSFFGEQIQNLLRIIQTTDWNCQKMSNKNHIPQEINLDEEYMDNITAEFKIDPELKVAWDPGNGAAGNITEKLKARLPNNNIIINSKIDGYFPSHHPDPTVPKNLEQLINVVKSQNCDFGVAFDGDADRIGVVTKSGRIIFGDQLLCLFAKDLLLSKPGATIIMDVKASQVAFDQIILNGGKPLMWKTGHSLIKTKMIETKALLAGEMSGHIFFADKYYGYDDGIYAAIRLLDIFSRIDASLDDLLDQLPNVYNTPEIKIITTDESKFKIISSIKQQLDNLGVNYNDIDGLRVNTKDGWWLLRASNTGPAIVARCESPSPMGLEILKLDLSTILADYNLKLE